MELHSRRRFVWVASALIVAALACDLAGGGASGPQPITGEVAPMTIGGDLTQVDVCAAVPQSIMEAAMGRALVKSPEKFTYYDTPDTNGCFFDAGKDNSGQAYYGYIVLTPDSVYDDQPTYLDEAVTGIGDAAYLNNGADARQLWVKINGKVSFVVAIGDVVEDNTLIEVGKLVAAAIK